MIGKIIGRVRRFIRQLRKVRKQVSGIRERMEYDEYRSQIWGKWREIVAGEEKQSLYLQATLGGVASLVMLGFWLVVEFFQRSHPFTLFCARGGLIVLMLTSFTAGWNLWLYFVEADELITKKVARHYEEQIAASTGTAAPQHAQTRSEFDRSQRTHTHTAAPTQNRPAGGGYAPPPRRR